MMLEGLQLGDEKGEMTPLSNIQASSIQITFWESSKNVSYLE